MRRNGRRTGELSVGVHAPHRVGHTVGSGTGRHVVRVKGTTGTAAGSNGEVLLTVVVRPLLVGAGYRMLETRRVSRVTRNGDVDVFMAHNRNAFRNVVGAIAANLSAFAVGVGLFTNDFELAGIVVELSLDVSKTVDAADNLGGVFSKAVQDDLERILANFIGVAGNTDSAFGRRKRFVSSEEAEATGRVAQKHRAKIAMPQTDFTLLGNASGNTEGLKPFANSGGGVSGFFAVLLERNTGAKCVRPNGVFKRDRLNRTNDLFSVDALRKIEIAKGFQIRETVLIQNRLDLTDSSFETFKRNHISIPYICYLFFRLFNLRGARTASHCNRLGKERVGILFETRIDLFDGFVKTTVCFNIAFVGFLGVDAFLDSVHHLAKADKLITNDLIVGVETDFENVTFGHFEVAGPLLERRIHRTDLRTVAFTEVFETGANC